MGMLFKVPQAEKDLSYFDRVEKERNSLMPPVKLG
jgi:hypothetical protein